MKARLPTAKPSHFDHHLLLQISRKLQRLLAGQVRGQLVGCEQAYIPGANTQESSAQEVVLQHHRKNGSLRKVVHRRSYTTRVHILHVYVTWILSLYTPIWL